MDRLCKDVGSSWSIYVWPKVSNIVPPDLIGGARLVRESYLTSLTPFYHSMVRSFAYVNNLFYQENKELSLPLNLWFIPGMPSVNKTWLSAGFCMVLDLPIESGKISITAVKSALFPADAHIYHNCCQFQNFYQGKFHLADSATHLVNPAMLLQSKMLLQLEH